jgi:hypothetical protein
LSDLRLEASPHEQRAILECVREHAMTNKGSVSAEALRAIWQKIHDEATETCA